MPEKLAITLEVNGESRSVDVEPRMLLTELLRSTFALTGTHVGCEHGVCGACTVLVDDQPVRSCLMLAVQADGCRVETVECLADGEQLSQLQRSMQDNHGLQCGFCTPGILMSITGEQRRGSCLDQALDDALGAHVCRCTGYTNIRAAIREHWSRFPQREEDDQ